MKKSEIIVELAKALALAQKKINVVVSDSKNPHFRSNYASLAAVRECVIPPLNEHGLSVAQLPGEVVVREQDAYATLGTVLVHSSGEWISSECSCKLQKNDPQGYGSAITYLRRYSLAALVGLAQDDDDGESHRQAPAKKQADNTVFEAIMGKIAAARDSEQLETAKSEAKSSWKLLTTEQQSAVKSAVEQAKRLVEGV